MVGVLILAAGKGTRMQSEHAKVLAPLGGEPMLVALLQAVKKSTPQAALGVVVGFQAESVRAAVESDARWKELNITWIEQDPPRGTGDAAKVAMEHAWGKARLAAHEDILVLPGDQPLISEALLQRMVEPLPRGTALRLLTTHREDPTGYGRVVRRGARGPVLRIVEERDANTREAAIQEVATSIYLFRAAFLELATRSLTPKNAQKEFYLTDVVSKAVRHKKSIDVVRWSAHQDVMGINSPWELAQAEQVLRERRVREWAERGVRMIDKNTTYIEGGVVLEPGAVLEPGVYLRGRSVIRKNARIKMGSVIDDSEVGEGAQVGPYAHLRPGSKVGREAKVGNFVELKKTTLGDRTSVAHLSYLGDATVGHDVNIGCGFVTCNFDGRIRNGERKHKTVIEDGAFIGSDCQAIAPITIGRGAYVASGSTLTESVEPEALAIARTRQTNKPGYARRLRDRD